MKVSQVDSESAVDESFPAGGADVPPDTGSHEHDIGPSSSVASVSSLLPADSPRLDGEDTSHTTKLASVDAALPPILVHRQTMRVIDGMHRLRAALLRGDEVIDVQFFNGSEDLAFVRAVEANIAHGLPLSLADREAAAARIIVAFPEWSDRAVAKSAGISGKTVCAIRRRATAEIPQLHMRIGRDGRLRPISSAEGRRVASDVIAARPDASLREIARIAGISPGTVRDVRQRLLRGENPIPDGQRDRGRMGSSEPSGARGVERPRMKPEERLSRLQNLKRDPSLRFSEAGRALLRWLDGHTVGQRNRASMLDAVPAHCASVVADLARECAGEWQHFADQLEQAAADPRSCAAPARVLDRRA